jgi:RNA polymerase sigma-70 factor (ECF subfamily)
MSDHALLNAYQKGERDAASALVERHRRRISDYIYMMVRDRATTDDIFQETLIKGLKFLDEGRYTDNGKFLSWMLRIAHNQVIDHFRRTHGQKHVNEADASYDLLNNSIFSDPTIEQTMVAEQTDSDLRALVELLPEEQREVVLMRYYHGMSFKEIAEKTDVSINTALGRMRYALINMRKLINEKQLVLV